VHIVHIYYDMIRYLYFTIYAHYIGNHEEIYINSVLVRYMNR